jgi:protein-tyrosine phosphatase
MATRSRLVALERSFNFRDLGGYVGHHGMVTRWGALFRSDTLHELTGADIETVRALGLATIVDLRTGRELERTGRGPLAEEPTAFRHLSLIRDGEGEAMAAPAPPGEELSLRYGWYLDGGRDSLVEALRLIADPSNLPLVFHCAAGKDRTGVLAALVLDILGVASEVIVADYVITAERMPLILERYRMDPALAANMDRVPSSRFGVEAQTMERFLADLYRQFGGARAWALASGVRAEELERMEEWLLVPPDSAGSAGSEALA